MNQNSSQKHCYIKNATCEPGIRKQRADEGESIPSTSSLHDMLLKRAHDNAKNGATALTERTPESVKRNAR